MLFFVLIFGSGMLVGWAGTVFVFPTGIAFHEQRLHSSSYRLINPLLECDSAQNISTEYRPSRTKIETIITKRQQRGDIATAAVYYRDLNNGPWTGIHETDEFTPASLLKVPVMMDYYKAAESNPTLLTQPLTYKMLIPQSVQYFEPQQKLEEGKEYSVEDLIDHMIKFSDNNALLLLSQHLDDLHIPITEVLHDLGIESPEKATLPDSMSVKSYSSLFRVLFNASYLSRMYSEKALQLLSESDFMPGIANQLPSHITVADKFGEREFDNGTKQLHDCGIIYYPNHPYLLCIMTQGKEYQPLADSISEISAAIYEDLHNHYH